MWGDGLFFFVIAGATWEQQVSAPWTQMHASGGVVEKPDRTPLRGDTDDKQRSSVLLQREIFAACDDFWPGTRLSRALRSGRGTARGLSGLRHDFLHGAVEQATEKR